MDDFSKELCEIFLDAPTFRNLPQDIAAEIGSPVKLRCDVDSQPHPEFQWLHYEEDQNIVSKNIYI